jgi:hypothetical protein
MEGSARDSTPSSGVSARHAFETARFLRPQPKVAPGLDDDHRSGLGGSATTAEAAGRRLGDVVGSSLAVRGRGLRRRTGRLWAGAGASGTGFESEAAPWPEPVVTYVLLGQLAAGRESTISISAVTDLRAGVGLNLTKDKVGAWRLTSSIPNDWPSPRVAAPRLVPPLLRRPRLAGAGPCDH